MAYGAQMADGLLGDLAAADQAELAALGVVRRYRAGAFILLEGDRDNHVIVVRQGRLRIVHTTDDGTEVLMAVRGPGEFVGELNALAGSDAPRAASAVALDDVTVQSITGADFLEFLEQHPRIAVWLLRQLAARLREASLRHTEAAGYDALHRVARVLVEHAEREGRDVEGGRQLEPGLSQADIAGLVAASPKSVGRALAVLRRRELVTTGRRSILIRDLDALRRFAET